MPLTLADMTKERRSGLSLSDMAGETVEPQATEDLDALLYQDMAGIPAELMPQPTQAPQPSSIAQQATPVMPMAQRATIAEQFLTPDQGSLLAELMPQPQIPGPLPVAQPFGGPYAAPQEDVSQGWLGEVDRALTRGGVRTVASGPGTLAAMAEKVARHPITRMVYPRAAQATDLPRVSRKAAKLQDVAKLIYDEAEMESLKPQKEGIGGYIVNTTFETLPLMAAATAAGATVGGAGAFAVGAMAEGEAAYQEAKKAGASEDLAQTERLVVGTINGFIERMQADEILKVGKGISLKSLRAIQQAAHDRAMGKLGKEVGKMTLGQVGVAVNEGLEETLQEAVQIGAATMHGDKIELKQDVQRIGKAGVGGLTAGGLLGLGSSTLQTMAQQAVEEEATRATDVAKPKPPEVGPGGEGFTPQVQPVVPPSRPGRTLQDLAEQKAQEVPHEAPTAAVQPESGAGVAETAPVVEGEKETPQVGQTPAETPAGQEVVPPEELETPQSLLDKYDNGEIATIMDLADEAERLADDTDNAALQKAVDEFRDFQEEDREFGMRGDMDEAEDALVEGIRNAQSTPSPVGGETQPTAPPPATVQPEATAQGEKQAGKDVSGTKTEQTQAPPPPAQTRTGTEEAGPVETPVSEQEELGTTRRVMGKDEKMLVARSRADNVDYQLWQSGDSSIVRIFDAAAREPVTHREYSNNPNKARLYFLDAVKKAGGTVEEFAPKPKPAVPKPTGKGKRLKGDYGVDNIDAYSDEGEKAKTAFLNDARSYLMRVRKALGWKSPTKKKTGISTNQGGIAVSGEVSLVLFPEGSDRGIYVNVMGSAGLIHGVKGSRSNVAIMWRTNTRKDIYSGGKNQWENWDITAEDLAEKIRAAVEREGQVTEQKSSGTAPVPKIEYFKEDAGELSVDLANDGFVWFNGHRVDIITQNSGKYRVAHRHPENEEVESQYTETDDRGEAVNIGAAMIEAALPEKKLAPQAPKVVESTEEATNEPEPGQTEEGARTEGQPGVQGVSAPGSAEGGGPARPSGARDEGLENAPGTPEQNVPGPEPATRPGVPAPELSGAAVEMAGQPATGTTGEGIPESGSDPVVPAASVDDVDAAAPSTSLDDNYDLRSAPPITLTKGQRRKINDQVKEILQKDSITEEDRDILRQYTGEGGLTSGTKEALNQHYTDYDTIKAMYRAISDSGFKATKALEPSVGSGNFVGMQPQLDWTTVDIDETNFEVVSKLYPKGKHYNVSFELFKARGYDLVISNVPFSEERGRGKLKNRPDVKALHDFYFLHALDRVRDNGIIAFVTSTGTMDKLDDSIRREIVGKADLLAAYRLPQGHFKRNAHTEVTTDVIFLQKRPQGVRPGQEQTDLNATFMTSSKTDDDITLSNYYQAFPENVLGSIDVGKDKLHGGRPTYVVSGPARLDEMRLPKYKAYQTDTKAQAQETEDIPKDSQEFYRWANQHDIRYKEGSWPDFNQNIEIVGDQVFIASEPFFFEDVERKMKIYRPDASLEAQKAVALNRILGLASDFQAGEQDAGPRGVDLIDTYRQQFKKHPTNDAKLRRFFKANGELSFFYELSGLFDKKWNPADVFSTQTKYTGSGRAEVRGTLAERAFANEDNKGVIDISRAESIDEEDVLELLGSGYALLDYTENGSVLQNEILYYSGNIYKKLDRLDALDVKVPDDYRAATEHQKNALDAIKPEPKTLDEIPFKGNEDWLYPLIQKHRIFRLEKDTDKNGITEWVTSDDIYNKYLNNHQLVIRVNIDKMPEPMADYMERVREAEDHVEEIKTRIRGRIQENDEAVQEIESAYNRRFRHYVKPSYERAAYLIQEVLDEIEANSPIKLRPNQVSWIVQAVYEGKGINAHDVGGGKTFAAIALARVLKKRGIAKKPIFVVPAKTIKKWKRDILTLFPDAKIIDCGALTADQRTKKLHEVANTNADYILISTEGFTSIKLPASVEKRYIDDVVSEHVDDEDVGGRAKAKLQEKIDRMKAMLEEEERDPRLTFDKLGIDMVVADEAHAYKNIGIRTRLVNFGIGKGFGVNSRLVGSGVFDKEGKEIPEEMVTLKSSRAYDFRFKANYIVENNNGNNVFLLTATPTPNKPMEIYTMLRHLSLDIFHEYGITTDDAFANMFFKFGTVEDRAKGRPKNILKAIVNAQELRGIINRYVDKIPMEQMPWIEIPNEKTIEHFLDQPDAYEIIAEDLRRRQQQLPKHPKKGDDTLVAIYTAGRAASVDPRLYGGEHAAPEALIEMRSHDADDDKIQFVLDQVVKVHQQNKDAGQLVFVDAAGHQQVARGQLTEDIHREIKAELVKAGFQEKEVALINGKVVTNPKTGKDTASGDRDAKKQEIADAYNQGKIKVVIGSTSAMGEGMDLQIKTTDIYHIDIPYTPGAFRQRNGRGVRYGNENKEVNVHYLLMRGTFDSLSFGIVSHKKGWNQALWEKDVAMEISTEEEMSEGAMPRQEQIQIELERDPERKQFLIFSFQYQHLLEQRQEFYQLGARGRERIARLQKQLRERLEILKGQRNRLETMEPDEKIQDPKERREKFEKKKKILENTIIISEKKQADIEQGIEKVRRSVSHYEEEETRLNGELAAFRAQHMDDNGNIIVRDSDIPTGEKMPEAPGGGTSGAPGFPATATKPHRQAEPTEVRVTARQIIETLSRALNVPIRGRATHRAGKRAGWYEIGPRGIRQVNLRDIDTAAHEIGHHIDHYYGIRVKGKDRAGRRRYTMPPGAPKKIADELLAMGKALYGSRKPPGGYKSEGVAEFVRGYLTGHIDVAKAAPNFNRWFRRDYLPNHQDLARALAEAKELYTKWSQQGAEARLESMVSEKKPKGPASDRVKRGWRWLRSAFYDELAPLELMRKELGFQVAETAEQRAALEQGRSAEYVLPKDDPFTLATYYNQVEGARARHMVMDATIDLYGNKTGAGLKEVMAPIVKQRAVNEFRRWMVAARALDLWDRDINPGLDRADAQYVYDKYKDNEGWKKVSQDVTDWNDRVLHYLVQAGGLEESAAQRMRELNPIYVPFLREFADTEQRNVQGAGRGILPTGKIHKIKGSGREIIDPYQSMISQARRIISLAHKTRVARAVADMADQAQGEAKLMWKVPAPKQATRFRAEQVKRQLMELGVEFPEAGLKDMDAILTVYTNAPVYLGKDHILSVVRDGKRTWYEVDPKLYRLLKGLDQFVLPNYLRWTIALPTRTIRFGATGVNAAFGWIRNPIRDALDTIFKARFARGPLATTKGLAMDLSTTGMARALGIKPSRAAEEFVRQGGEITGFIGQDRKAIDHVKGEMLASTVGRRAIHTVRHPIDAMRMLFGISESAPRIAEYGAALRHYEKLYGKDSPDAKVMAFNAASDQTINFRKHGWIGKYLNQMIPFWNANVQDHSKFVRTLKARGVEASAWAIVFLTLPALALWWRHRDEEWYEELPDYERANYLHFETNEDTIVRIPVPFLVGHLFQSIPVATLDALYRADPKRVTDILGKAFEADIAPVYDTPAAIQPLIEVARNRDWSDRPIVSESLLNKPVSERYREYTSEFSKAFAKTFNRFSPKKVAPVQIDYLMNAYSGGLYRRQQKVAAQLLLPPEARQPSDIPIAGTLFVRDPFAPRETIENYYETRQKLNERYQSEETPITGEELVRRSRMNRIGDDLSEQWNRLRNSKAVAERKEIYREMKQLIETTHRPVTNSDLRQLKRDNTYTTTGMIAGNRFVVAGDTRPGREKIVKAIDAELKRRKEKKQ